MNKLPIFLALAIILASCNAESASSDANTSPAVTSPETGKTAGLQSIRSQETKALLAQQPDIVMLDVRTPEEYAAGHLKGAQLINFYSPDFLQRVQALDPAKTYLVYCAVGGRSKKAVQRMARLGFKQVYDAAEGFRALQNAGIPTE
jgi:phage shock protein E